MDIGICQRSGTTGGRGRGGGGGGGGGAVATTTLGVFFTRALFKGVANHIKGSPIHTNLPSIQL